MQALCRLRPPGSRRSRRRAGMRRCPGACPSSVTSTRNRALPDSRYVGASEQSRRVGPLPEHVLDLAGTSTASTSSCPTSRTGGSSTTSSTTSLRPDHRRPLARRMPPGHARRPRRRGHAGLHRDRSARRTRRRGRPRLRHNPPARRASRRAGPRGRRRAGDDGAGDLNPTQPGRASRHDRTTSPRGDQQLAARAP